MDLEKFDSILCPSPYSVQRLEIEMQGTNNVKYQRYSDSGAGRLLEVQNDDGDEGAGNMVSYVTN